MGVTRFYKIVKLLVETNKQEQIKNLFLEYGVGSLYMKF
jgi:hypothetical protein